MTLGAALGWKYDNTPGICTVDGVLTAWPDALGPAPDEAAQAAIVAEYEDYLANPPPVEAQPTRIACALRVPVENDEVQVIGGSYRVAAMMLMDTGTFLAIFSQNLGETQPYLIPNNGVSIEITEWGGDYAMLEIRDHAGGTLITPASFGFSLYNF